MKSFKFIHRLSAGFSGFALIWFGQSAAFGQMPGGDKGAGGMNAALVKLFGSNTNFIAKVDIRVLDKNQQETTSMPMAFEMLAGKIRFELNMLQVKSREMSPDFANSMKQMGMDQMTTLILPDRKIIVSIYPGLHAYAETPMSKDEADASVQAYKIDKKHIGKETLDGHACEKLEATITDEKGVKQKATVWDASDLKDFPIQIQIPEDDSTLILKFKDIRLGRPETSHFQAPAGMTKFDSVNALMSDAVTRKMSGAGK